MNEFWDIFGTSILNQDEINDLNRTRSIEIEAVIKNILTKSKPWDQRASVQNSTKHSKKNGKTPKIIT